MTEVKTTQSITVIYIDMNELVADIWKSEHLHSCNVFQE